MQIKKESAAMKLSGNHSIRAKKNSNIFKPGASLLA